MKTELKDRLDRILTEHHRRTTEAAAAQTAFTEGFMSRCSRVIQPAYDKFNAQLVAYGWLTSFELDSDFLSRPLLKVSFISHGENDLSEDREYPYVGLLADPETFVVTPQFRTLKHDDQRYSGMLGGDISLDDLTEDYVQTLLVNYLDVLTA